MTFIVMSLALEIEMGHLDRIHAMAHVIADVQDKQVFGPAGINAPRNARIMEDVTVERAKEIAKAFINGQLNVMKALFLMNETQAARVIWHQAFDIINKSEMLDEASLDCLDDGLPDAYAFFLFLESL